ERGVGGAQCNQSKQPDCCQGLGVSRTLQGTATQTRAGEPAANPVGQTFLSAESPRQTGMSAPRQRVLSAGPELTATARPVFPRSRLLLPSARPATAPPAPDTAAPGGTAP